jgi:hypothetical protein
VAFDPAEPPAQRTHSPIIAEWIAQAASKCSKQTHVEKLMTCNEARPASATWQDDMDRWTACVGVKHTLAEAVSACAERVANGDPLRCEIDQEMWHPCIAACEARARAIIHEQSKPVPPGGRIDVR